jgi:adenine-specific DNA-methyltransferase
MLKRLHKVFDEYVDKNSIFGDYFAGTGTVAFDVAHRYQCQVIANDLQYYAYVINKANLARYSSADIRIINEAIANINQLSPVKGFISREYAPPKRMYFTRYNAQRIDAARVWLEQKRPTFKSKVYFYLLAKVIVTADKLANTSSVYAAYLKEFKTSAQKHFFLTPFSHVDNHAIHKQNKVFNLDINTLTKQAQPNPTVVYLDPPYNTRQYSDNYHLLDTIAKYDHPKIHGITGIRDELTKSDFASKTKAEAAFVSLVQGLASVPVLILSYNDEGILTHQQMRKILKAHGKVKLIKIKYPKFKAQDGIDREYLYEYIFISVK